MMNKSFQEPNLTMLTDFYELTMANGYFANGFQDTICYFDMFFRKVPDNGGFAIMAGVEQLVEYLQNLHLHRGGHPVPPLQTYLQRGILGIPAGFYILLRRVGYSRGHAHLPRGAHCHRARARPSRPSLWKPWCCCASTTRALSQPRPTALSRAAQGRAVMEFGSRRAQGFDGAMYGARAAYIGGCVGTACTISDQMFGVPALGTMAHSWVQLFPTEYEAFKAYAQEYPANCVLLVDTYNVLKSGVPNAIKVFNEVLVPRGFRPAGIRIDSGDITYLSRKARKMLDDAGFEDCPICASNSLDEYIIRDMLMQGAKVDSFGVGERLITSSSEPVFGGVYKLAAVEDKEGQHHAQNQDQRERGQNHHALL